MEDYAIICNPLAGKQQKGKSPIEFASEYLDNFKVSYKLFHTEYARHAIELATCSFNIRYNSDYCWFWE